MFHKQAITARNADGVLRVVEIGRVSTENQPLSNIEAGYAYAEGFLKGSWDGPVEIRRFGEQASGMIVNRQSIEDALELIESGWADLVLMEDLSKSFRNPRWILAFVQDCVDRDVRVIAPGDSLDTADENWELMVGAGAFRHGMHVPETRRRVRRTASHTFDGGGMVLRTRFGYRKLTKEEAASGQFGPVGLRLAKVAELTVYFQKLREMVVDGHKGGAALADWLNSQDPPVPPPPYAKRKGWNGKLVLDLLRDPLLYGLRQFPKVRHEALFGNPGKSPGKRKQRYRRRKNAQPQHKLYAELAHMTQPEWEEMNRVLDELGGRNKRTKGAQHPRHRVARHKSLCGLQHATCVACEDFLYLSGSHVIKCKNANARGDEACWTHVEAQLPLLRERLVDLALRVMLAHPEARRLMLEEAWQEIRRRQARTHGDLREVERQIADLQIQAGRLANAIAEGGNLQALVSRSKETEQELKKARQRRKQLVDGQDQGLPGSLDQLQVEPRAALLDLAGSSFEFADLMRRIFPSLVIQPVQALDSGQVRPRALLTFDLAALLPQDHSGVRPAPEEFPVDLFQPPEHIKHAKAVHELRQAKQDRGEKATLDVLAEELNIGRMTVKRAIGYRKLMAAEGLTEPYRVLAGPPAKASRWKPRRRPELGNAAA